MIGKHGGKAGVHISEKHRSVKYIGSSVQHDALSIKSRRHSSEEFERFQLSSEDQWASKYYYLLTCIVIGIGQDVFPIMMEFAHQVSGGGFLLIMLCYSLIAGIPLIYMETFLGRYTKLTNCQMYRMAPIFFGVCFTLFVLNAIYQPLHVSTATQLLVNLLKLLANPHINMECMDNSTECYDYVKEGKLNDTCKYGHISMICEKRGEIRYLMQYQYWKTFKDPSSPKFPYYQLITGVVISWIVILTIVMKKLQSLGKLINVAFTIQTVALTMIFLLALSKDGAKSGLSALVYVNFEGVDFFQILVLQWYSLARLGLIIPSGYMTFSAYAKFGSDIGTECLIIVICSVIVSIYYLAVFFTICGVIADAMGVDVTAVIIPDKGLFLAVVPQFLVQLRMPNIFLILYYGSLWFTEIAKIGFYQHMLILNLYDYFPTLKNFSTYIWVTSCLFLCLLSIPASQQFTNTIFIPMLWGKHLMIILGMFISLEASMVSYFYGVTRLSDDIHFMTGHRPMRFLRVMWYIIPFAGWCSIFCMFPIMRKSFQKNEAGHGEEDELGWLYATLAVWGYICLMVFSTIMYIAFRFGHPNLLLMLVKPQYFWGPSERGVREQRKTFQPRTSIRSQHFRSRMKTEREHFHSIQQDGVLLSEFSRDVLVEQSGRGDILKDKLFFEHIGLFSHMTKYTFRRGSFTEEKGRELDVTDDK